MTLGCTTKFTEGVAHYINKLDTFVWNILSWIYTPIFRCVLKILESHIFIVLKTRVIKWWYSTSWHWRDYMQFVVAFIIWSHTRIILAICTFYRFLRKIWLTWLILWIIMTFMAAITEQSNIWLGNVVYKSIYIKLLKIVMLWATRGCYSLSVLLSFPISLPLAFPYVIAKQKYTILQVIMGWIKLLQPLVFDLLYYWYIFLCIEVWNASIWFWVFVLLPIWKLILWLCGMFIYIAISVWVAIGWITGLVVGCFCYGCTIIANLISVPLSLIEKLIDLLPKP